MGAFSNLAASQMTMMTGMLKDGSYHSIDRETMEKVLGPSRLRSLKDMLHWHVVTGMLLGGSRVFSMLPLTTLLCWLLQADVPAIE
jgi:hypothetical protein